MLLVAYLRQHAGHRSVRHARWELIEMIEISDNDAANWVYTTSTRRAMRSTRSRRTRA